MPAISPAKRAMPPIDRTLRPDFRSGCLVNFVVLIPSAKRPTRVIPYVFPSGLVSCSLKDFWTFKSISSML